MPSPRFRVVVEPVQTSTADGPYLSAIRGGAPQDGSTVTNYLIRYEVDGQLFCYYPSEPAFTLNDLLHEATLFGNGVSHDMQVDGYTILVATIVGDLVTFGDTLIRPGQHPEPVAPPVALGEVTNAFRDAADSMARLVREQYPEEWIKYGFGEPQNRNT